MFDPSTTPRSRAWIEVRLDRIRYNAIAALRASGSGVGLLPMVKADAYGLGFESVVRTLADVPECGGPWGFGVATVAEGEALRRFGWAGRVLVTAPAAPAELKRAGEASLTLSFSTLASLHAWAEIAGRLSRELGFHTEVDTGMGRAGFPWSTAHEWAPAVASAAEGRLRWEGCFTHFHSADEPDLTATDQQWERFQQALAVLPTAPEKRVVHCANSAATMRRSGYGGQLVRPGIFLYGGMAGPHTTPAPVATVRARLILVREVPENSTVGYGATYRATRPERWGTVAIGYGDGIPRALATGGGQVLIRGRQVPIIGRVSMDMLTIDLTSVDEAVEGDVVTLIGEDGGVEITLDEVARRCGTISYEILTGLSPRLPRVYMQSEEAAV
ncbi:alanine racemase [soil metagenome]